MDVSKQFSETDYSETESEAEGGVGGGSGGGGGAERDKEKDKSKFGSLKKLTHRMQRSESSEHVGAASLDRKYLRFFSRHRADAKPAKVTTRTLTSFFCRIEEQTCVEIF